LNKTTSLGFSFLVCSLKNKEMSSVQFVPMPELLASQSESTFNSSERASGSIERVRDSMEVEESNKFDEEMSVETTTTSCTHYINWVIDHRSLHIAKLAPKGDKRGVIEANVEKGQHRFKLELCASGWRNSQDGYCAFYLTVADQDDLFVARYRVQIGEITRISSIRHDFHLGVGFPNFCQQDTLDSVMSDSNVKFLVTVEVFSCASKVKPPPRPYVLRPTQNPESVLAQVMKRLFSQREHADVALLCSNGVKVPAHKAVLAAVSPVFRSMFAHNMVESSTNEVRMTEWDPKTVVSMVHYVYNANLSNPFSMRNGSLEIDESCSLSFGHATPSPSPPSDTDPNFDLGNTFSFRSQSAIMMDDTQTIGGLGDGDSTEEIHGLDEDEDMVDSGVVRASSGESKIGDTMAAGSSKESMSGPRSEDCGRLVKHSTFQLFQLAEFYKIQPLVIACCEKMHRDVTVTTACDLLIRIERYAHVPEISTIKDSIWQFVTNHIREVKKTEGYAKVMRRHPELLSQLIDKITP
jgi:hypothetical protein